MGKQIIQLLIVTYLMVFLIGCSDKELNAKVNLDLEKVAIDDISKYSVSTYNNGEVNAKEVAKLNLKKDEKDVIALVDEFDNAILMSIKYEGDDEVDISMESSAEVIVLKSPRFIGAESNNPKELSNRIRRHKDFKKLVEKLEYSISVRKITSPLSYRSNGYVFSLANDLAYNLNVDDLFEGAK